MSKKAFLVGINDYAPVGIGGSDLSGCVNDAEDMANTLFICGFEAKNIRIYTDKNATKEGIIKGLNWLIKNSKKGDNLVFYYSGHGSQVVDLDGDEIDKKDEILCPHDMDFMKKIYVADDDLRKIFSKLSSGVNLEVLLDSCHSGTGTREQSVDKRARYLAPPIDYSFHIDYEPQLKTVGLLKDREIVTGLNHVLWSGCKSNQTSEEVMIDDKVRGVFTYNFCQILRRSNGNIERKKLYNLLVGAIKREGYNQVPQLESSKNAMTEIVFK